MIKFVFLISFMVVSAEVMSMEKRQNEPSHESNIVKVTDRTGERHLTKRSHSEEFIESSEQPNKIRKTRNGERESVENRDLRKAVESLRKEFFCLKSFSSAQIHNLQQNILALNSLVNNETSDDTAVTAEEKLFDNCFSRVSSDRLTIMCLKHHLEENNAVIADLKRKLKKRKHKEQEYKLIVKDLRVKMFYLDEHLRKLENLMYEKLFSEESPNDKVKKVIDNILDIGGYVNVLCQYKIDGSKYDESDKSSDFSE